MLNFLIFAFAIIGVIATLFLMWFLCTEILPEIFLGGVKTQINILSSEFTYWRRYLKQDFDGEIKKLGEEIKKLKNRKRVVA